MTRILIAANGEMNKAIISKRIEIFKPEVIIGADGGTKHLIEMGYRPDHVIGDLDSLEEILAKKLHAEGVKVEKYPAEKDETDLELALLAATRYEEPHIVVVAAAGGRLDMTLANVLLISHEAFRDIHIELWEDEQTLQVLSPSEHVISGQVGETVSLIPLKGDVLGITTHGLKYALENDTLLFGPARGVSNVLINNEAHVTFSAGLLLVVHTKGDPQ